MDDYPQSDVIRGNHYCYCKEFIFSDDVIASFISMNAQFLQYIIGISIYVYIMPALDYCKLGHEYVSTPATIYPRFATA